LSEIINHGTVIFFTIVNIQRNNEMMNRPYITEQRGH